MAGIKISELPATSIILEDDQIPLSRGDSTRRVSGNQFLTKTQVQQLSASIFSLTTQLSVFEDQTSSNIQQLSADIISLSAVVENKKRWADFTSI